MTNIDYSEAKQRLLMALKNGSIDEYTPIRMKKGYRYLDAERITSLNPVIVRSLLEELADFGKLSRRIVHNLVACPTCGSTDLQLLLTCSECGSTRIKLGITYQCSNCQSYFLKEEIQEEERIKCPKCGVDRPRYDKTGSFYACLNCNSILVLPVWRALCRSCGLLFDQEEAGIVELYSYSLPESKMHESTYEAILNYFSNEFKKAGFSASREDTLKGLSGVLHRFSLIVKDNGDEKTKLVIDIASGTNEVDERYLLSFIIKVRDVRAENSLLVVTSNINSKAEKLAQKQGIHILKVKNKTLQKNKLKPILHDLLIRMTLKTET